MPISNIHVKIDEDTKNEAQSILKGLGMDLSVAIKIYLKQIVMFQGIPLSIMYKNEAISVKEERIIVQSAAANDRQEGKSPKIKSVKDKLEYLKDFFGNK